MSKPSPQKWFWAQVLLMTVPKAHKNDPEAMTEVWSNLIVVRAKNPDAAYKKACRVGRADSGDSRGSLTLYGKPAITKFIGLADLGLVHDGLEDGSEIMWTLLRLRQRKAKTKVSRKSEIFRKWELKHLL